MLLDTHAWVEFIRGTERGKKVRNFLKKETCFTSQISVAEISSWCCRVNLNRKTYLALVKSQSRIIPLTDDLLEHAGQIHCDKRKKIRDFGLIDAIILSTAKHYSLPIVTGDRHFETENSIML